MLTKPPPGLSEQREGGRAASDARAPRDATHNWRTTKGGTSARARLLHTRLPRLVHTIPFCLRVPARRGPPPDGSPLIVWIPTPCGRSHAGARQRFSVFALACALPPRSSDYSYGANCLASLSSFLTYSTSSVKSYERETFDAPGAAEVLSGTSDHPWGLELPGGMGWRK